MCVRLCATVLVTGALVLTAAAQEPDRIYVVLPRDAIPAIDDPELVPAATGTRLMIEEELVIGLVGEGEQRAYSTWELDQHEIVNDVFEGRPVAVTW
jgi:hypothetical protein